MKNTLTLAGLLMTALGAWLLWKFGLPASVDREGAVHFVSFKVDEDEKKKAKFFDRVAGGGFLLIIVGSLLQGVALYVG
jgi:hypothetical protein